jgi:hypothetical protein
VTTSTGKSVLGRGIIDGLPFVLTAARRAYSDAILAYLEARAALHAVTAEPTPDYETWVGRVADAIHETCRNEWRAILVVDPSRQITQHLTAAHYGMAHDLVRRLRLADPADAPEGRS